MNFNDFVENKDLLIKSIGPIFDLDVGKDHTNLVDATIVQPKYTYNECMVMQIPYQYNITLDIEYTGKDGPNYGKHIFTEIKVPKLCENGFLALNAEGKLNWRSPIRVGEIKNRLVVRDPDEFRNIQFRSPDICKIYPLIRNTSKFKSQPSIEYYKYDKNTSLVEWDLIDYLNHFGIDKNEITKYVTEGVKYRDLNKDYKLIEIPVELINYYNNKIYQLINIEANLTESNNKLDPNILFELIKLYFNDPLKFEPFSPFDVTFYDYADQLFGRELHKVQFIKYKLAAEIGKFGAINGDFITLNISKSLNMMGGEQSIQASSTSNAASFLSQTNKIYFKDWSKERKELQYTSDFYGVVCPSKTPESVSLCNIKNELASDVSIDDNNELLITLLNNKLKKVTIPYSKYYRSKVLSIDSFDYDKMAPKPVNGEVKVFIHGEMIKVPYTGLDSYDYIRDTPESALSINTGLIPFSNRVDGVRMSMATNMIDQSIPVLGAKKSIIHTSVNNLVYEKSDLNYKSDVEGKVEDIVNDYIKIKLDNGSYKILTAPRSIESSFHTYNSFRPAVKIGQKVKKGTVLLESDSFIDNELALTVPLKVAYFSYGAKTDEDAIIISDRASKLLAHKEYKRIKIEVPAGLYTRFNKELIKSNLEKSVSDSSKLIKFNEILNKLNEFSLPIIGMNYDYKDFLSYYLQDQEENTPLASLQAITKRSDDDTNLMKPMIVRLPTGLLNGEVTNVRLFYKNTAEVINRYKDLIDHYNDIHNKFIKSIAGDLTGVDIPEYKINLVNKSDPDLVILIDITSINEVKIGDKITNRYASKGTISAVLPLDMMPRVGGKNGEPVDICMPPMSTINRKNLAQLIEMNLCELCKIAHSLVSTYLLNDDIDKAKEVLNKLYITDKFINYSKNDLIRYHEKFKDGYYSITVRAIDNVYTLDKLNELNKYFGYSDKGEKLYIPKYDCMTMEPINVGTTEIMRLHFLPELKAKATALNKLTHNDNMVMGIGAQKSEGQRIGQMENWALNAYDTLGEFNKLKGTTSENSYNDSINMIATSMKLLALDPRGIIN